MPELRVLTQSSFVSRGQMICDTISSSMITHWCLPLLRCPGWAVWLLCIGCAQPMFTVHSSNPALKTELFILTGFFSYDRIARVAQKNRRCAGSPRHFPSADVWPGNCNNAPEGEEGEGFTCAGERGKKNKGNSLGRYHSEAHLTHQQNSKSPVQTVYLHLQFLAPV